jgi:hypothetical protein
MYGISPDDRLWLVKRDQDERRQAAEAGRMAASAGSGADRPSRLDAPLAGAHRAWARVRHALSVHHPVAHHGTVR